MKDMEFRNTERDDEMDQRQLIDRCRLGDLKSFEDLYTLYKKKALGTAYLIGGSKSIAEDTGP